MCQGVGKSGSVNAAQLAARILALGDPDLADKVAANRAAQVDKVAKQGEELAQRLNILLSTRTSDVHFTFNGRRFTAPLVNLDSIKVGNLEVQNIPTLIWDLSDYPQIEGVLGISYLKHFQVELNTKDHLFILTKRHS